MSYYSYEAEQAVLGSILLSPDLVHESTLTPEDFHHPGHMQIYRSMCRLRDLGERVNTISIVADIGEHIQVMGGNQYLLDLRASIPTTADFSSYARIVKDKSLVRMGISDLRKIYQDGNDNPKELAASIQSVAESLTDQSQQDKGFTHISQGIRVHFDVLEGKKLNGLPLGASTAGRDLDHITGKWQKQTLNIIAARPSVGKTAFLLNNAVKNAMEGMTVAIFSLEQPELQLYDRMISAKCMIDGERIRSGDLKDDEWVQYTLGLAQLAELDIYINDTPGLSIQEIRSSVKSLKREKPNLIVYVDYLQLITGGKKFANRNDEVGYVSSSLKQMARENDCPVVPLAQLSRSVEQRQDKRPMLSDLRESGNIEQDADTITFLYRDDYYNQATEKKHIIEMIVAKNRNGSVGTAEMVNLKNFGLFRDYERAHYSGEWPKY